MPGGARDVNQLRKTSGFTSRSQERLAARPDTPSSGKANRLGGSGNSVNAAVNVSVRAAKSLISQIENGLLHGLLHSANPSGA